jgi:hypothetical protein
MPRTEINIGTTANDKTGTKWRDAWGFVNEMTAELYANLPSNIVYIKTPANFGNQDANSIYLDSKVLYVLEDSIETDKNYVVDDGAAFTGFNLYGHTSTYTGSGTMFSGTDANFNIFAVGLECSSTGTLFNFNDTVGGVKRFNLNQVLMNQAGTPCASFGTFNNLLSTIMELAACNSNQGMSFTGSTGVLATLNKVALRTSVGVGYRGINLGSALFTILEMSDLFVSAPAGAFGLSGLANSGNVRPGALAMVNKSDFVGGCTDLENITTEDSRWSFKDNNPTADTIVDMLLTMTDNATATSAPVTPTKLAGTFTTKRDSFFDTASVNGRAIYIGERDITGPVDIGGTFNVSSGTNRNVLIYVAKNGTEITDTKKEITVNAGRVEFCAVADQLTLSTNDYIEIFVEQDTVDVTGVDVTFRFK